MIVRVTALFAFALSATSSPVLGMEKMSDDLKKDVAIGAAAGAATILGIGAAVVGIKHFASKHPTNNTNSSSAAPTEFTHGFSKLPEVLSDMILNQTDHTGLASLRQTSKAHMKMVDNFVKKGPSVKELFQSVQNQCRHTARYFEKSGGLKPLEAGKWTMSSKWVNKKRIVTISPFTSQLDLFSLNDRCMRAISDFCGAGAFRLQADLTLKFKAIFDSFGNNAAHLDDTLKSLSHLRNCKYDLILGKQPQRSFPGSSMEIVSKYFPKLVNMRKFHVIGTIQESEAIMLAKGFHHDYLEELVIENPRLRAYGVKALLNGVVNLRRLKKFEFKDVGTVDFGTSAIYSHSNELSNAFEWYISQNTSVTELTIYADLRKKEYEDVILHTKYNTNLKTLNVCKNREVQTSDLGSAIAVAETYNSDLKVFIDYL